MNAPTAPHSRETPHIEVGSWSGRAYPRNAVVVGYDGRRSSRAAVAWAAHEAAERRAPLVVLHAANYPGMDTEPGPGLLHREPGALDAAEEVTARGVAEALAAHPGIDVFGATEVTGPVDALVGASAHAALVVVGSRGRGRLAAALGGSVASATAARAQAPVVVVRPGSWAKGGPRAALPR